MYQTSKTSEVNMLLMCRPCKHAFCLLFILPYLLFKHNTCSNIYLFSVRVQAHAASAILNFSENCRPDILTPYLDGIVGKLLLLLQVVSQAQASLSP